MDNKVVENWQDYTKSALASVKELEVINTRVFEKLTGKQMELANTAFEAGTRYMSALSEVKAYPEFVSEQAKMIAEFNETLITTARGSADIMSEAREAYQAWFEQGLKSLTANANFEIPGFAPLTRQATVKTAKAA